MNPTNPSLNGDTTRRDFLKTTTLAAAGTLAAQLALTANAHAAGSDTIKVGIIGCGGRGTGAGEDVLLSSPNVTIHALADAFQDRLDKCKNDLTNFANKETSVNNRGDKPKEKLKELGNKLDVGDRCFVGLDAYEKLLKTDVNYVILATPPGFRPVHLAAAVAAGKNIFTEKPVAVDAPGYRSVIDTYKQALDKKLAIVAGTQRRHQLGYVEAMKRVHGGEIGDITAGRCYWNQGILWHVPRQSNWTDLEAQMRNWYNFTWLCGDHIVEQHVHNIDVINWALGTNPVRAVGMGGRQRSVPDPENWGHIFDHFAVDLEYPNGLHVLSMCRQIAGCENNVSEAVVGAKGTWDTRGSRGRPYHSINDKDSITREQSQIDLPYIQEHTHLIKSIRDGKPLNELEQVANSTMTAILGRMSTYTGKAITWDQAIGSREVLMPPQLDWKMTLQTPPVAVPGKTQFV
jgi:predicted dehydrogenase